MFSKAQKYVDDCRGIIRADLFVSVGGVCRPAHYLRRFHLRSFSSPFDWITNYKLEHIIHFLRNDGADFFANIEYMGDDEWVKTHSIKDTNTGMISIHDFPLNKSVEEYYPDFIAKYKRRFANLKKALQKSKCIVFLSYRNETLQEFQIFLNEMQKIHSAEYIFVNIRHNENLATMTKSIINMSNGGGEIIEYSFNDKHLKGSDIRLNPNAWLGNVEQWNKIVCKFRLPLSVAFINFLNRKIDKFKRHLVKQNATSAGLLD